MKHISSPTTDCIISQQQPRVCYSSVYITNNDKNNKKLSCCWQQARRV